MTKLYTINLWRTCRVFESQKLLVKAMEALPADAVIHKINYDPMKIHNGSIEFTSVLLIQFDSQYPLELVVDESVRLALEPKR
jgi:hypothetical protein